MNIAGLTDAPLSDLPADWPLAQVTSSGGRMLMRYGTWILCLFAFLHPVFLIPPWGDFSFNKFLFLNLFTVLMIPVFLLLIGRGASWGNLGVGQALGWVCAAMMGGVLLFRYEFYAIAFLYLLETLILLGIFWRGGLGPFPRAAGLTLLVILIITTLASPYHQRTIYGHANLYTGFITFMQMLLLVIAVLALIRTEPAFWNLIDCMIGGGVLIGLLSMGQYLRLPVLAPSVAHPHYLTLGCGSTVGNPNWQGAYLVVVLAMAVGRFLYRPHAWRLLAHAALFGGLITTLTRGAWLGFLSFLTTLWLCNMDRKKLIRLGLVYLLVTLALLPVNDWKLAKRLFSFVPEATLVAEGDDFAGSFRLKLWKWAITLVPSHAVLGSGLDTLDQLGQPGKEALEVKAHNIYLDYAITIGIPGLLVYLYLLCNCLWKARGPVFATVARCFLAAYLVNGCFLHDTIQAWPFVWMVMGLCLATHRWVAPNPFP